MLKGRDLVAIKGCQRRYMQRVRTIIRDVSARVRVWVAPTPGLRTAVHIRTFYEQCIILSERIVIRVYLQFCLI